MSNNDAPQYWKNWLVKFGRQILGIFHKSAMMLCISSINYMYFLYQFFIKIIEKKKNYIIR
jgi:hypothetical protein